MSVSGTWVYTDPKTLETLHLHQGKGGTVTGDGTAIDRDSKGHPYHSGISVQSGKMQKNRLTLSLYVSQIDWGSGLTIVENLRCTVTSRALHCLMDAPLYATARNVKQDFVRHA